MRTQASVFALAVIMLFSAIQLFGQERSASQAASSTDVKPRVFVIDSRSSDSHTARDGSNGTWGADASANTSAQSAAVTKTFAQKCIQVQIASKHDDADYVVELQDPGGKDAPHRKGRVVIFDRRSGDSVANKSIPATASVDELLRDACGLVVVQWGLHSSELIQMSEIEADMAPAHNDQGAGAATASPNLASVSITSNPSGADIQIDGNYVGSTPSVVRLAPGIVLIKIQKKGFNSWERKLKVSGGDVKVSADLDASAN